MKATLLLVTFGVLLQVSWGAVVAVGDSVRRPDPPGPSDPKDTKGQLQDDSKEIGEQLVLDDKSKVLQYSILGNAGDAENCEYTQGVWVLATFTGWTGRAVPTCTYAVYVYM